MRPFGEFERFAGIAAEIGGEEIRRLRQREMQRAFALHFEAQVPPAAIEQMPAMAVIGGEEMAVPARHVDRLGVVRRPEADDDSGHALQAEFALIPPRPRTPPPPLSLPTPPPPTRPPSPPAPP